MFAVASCLQDNHHSWACKLPPIPRGHCLLLRVAHGMGHTACWGVEPQKASTWWSQASDPGLSHGRRSGTRKPCSPAWQGLGFLSGWTWKALICGLARHQAHRRPASCSPVCPAQGPRVLRAPLHFGHEVIVWSCCDKGAPDCSLAKQGLVSAPELRVWLACCPATLKKWLPRYCPFPVRGKGESEVLRMSRK